VSTVEAEQLKPESVDWAAKRLDLSRSTVLALIKSGKLRCRRLGTAGRIIRITEDHITEYLQSTETRLASEQPKVSIPPVQARRIV